MAFSYPAMLELSGRRAVVIGRLAVSEGKDVALREAGAEVAVFAEGEWSPESLDGAFVCVASSDDPAERDAIGKAARERGVLVNVMDDAPNCDFAAPAIVRRGDLVLAVGTGGRSPALARKVREDLSVRYGQEWAEVLAIVGEVRERSRERISDPADRARRWREALHLGRAASLVRAGRGDELRRRLLDRLGGSSP
jgi:precorrin-2 dehydrogenase / sirohydrochlorin ferrochelatase